jgi:hypothetical protein
MDDYGVYQDLGISSGLLVNQEQSKSAIHRAESNVAISAETGDLPSSVSHD